MKVVYYDKIELEKKGDEKTAIRFTLNPDGERAILPSRQARINQRLESCSMKACRT